MPVEPKTSTCQSVTLSTDPQARTARIVFDSIEQSNPTLYTTSASHVYHTTLWAPHAASKNIAYCYRGYLATPTSLLSRRNAMPLQDLDLVVNITPCSTGAVCDLTFSQLQDAAGKRGLITQQIFHQSLVLFLNEILHVRLSIK